jgi:acyl-coenzyme A thioesterase PaaI-like protein
LLGHDDQLGDADGVEELADRGLVQAELAADRRLVPPLSGQFVHGGVVLTEAGHDPHLG